MGSRAQLADVPKLHELIEAQVRLSWIQLLLCHLIFLFFSNKGQETDL